MVVQVGAAVVYVVWQGAVRIVGSKLAKELVKAGAKHLTKKNFKKTYDFFKGDKKIKTSEKNKILEDLNIVTPKIKKVSKVPKIPKKEVKKPEVKKPEKDLLPGIKPGESVYAYYARMAKESRILADKKIPKAPKKDIVKKPEVPKTEVKKPEIPKSEVKPPEKLHAQVKEHLQSGGSADKGAKIVEEVTKKGVLEQTKNLLFPKVISKRGFYQYGAYGAGGIYAASKAKGMMSKEAADAIKRVQLEKKKEKEKETKKTTEDIYQKNVDESTLGVIDLNIIADTEHKWKTDNSGNYVVE
jgi:hypothetical protein